MSLGVACSCIMGVRRGEALGFTTCRDTAGTMEGEVNVTLVGEVVDLRELSEPERLRLAVGEVLTRLPFKSMCVGTDPLCIRLSWLAKWASRFLLAKARCCSRIKKMNRFRRTHFPMFTATKFSTCRTEKATTHV